VDDVIQAGLASTPTRASRGEPVLKEQQVQEILARVARGEPVLGIARALGMGAAPQGPFGRRDRGSGNLRVLHYECRP